MNGITDKRTELVERRSLLKTRIKAGFKSAVVSFAILLVCFYFISSNGRPVALSILLVCVVMVSGSIWIMWLTDVSDYLMVVNRLKKHDAKLRQRPR